MSLDKFAKPGRKQDDEKPAEKPAAAKGEKPQKPAKKAPARSKAKPAPVEDDDDEIGGPPQDEESQDDGAAGGAAIPRDSALKAMGLVKFALSCPACKFKRELHVSGEPKPHQLLCKKCGGTMKASKKI